MFFQQNFVSGCDGFAWVGRVLMGGGLVNVVGVFKYNWRFVFVALRLGGVWFLGV